MKKLLLVSNLIMLVSVASAQIDRIQSARFDRSQTKRIYLAPGLGSIVLFPCALSEVFVGRSEDLKVQISPNDKKTLFLNLKLNTSLPTNLIAKCEGERNVFVFDVIPSQSKHQDVFEIRSSYGSPGNNVRASELINIKKSNRIVLKQPVLIENGEAK